MQAHSFMAYWMTCWQSNSASGALKQTAVTG